MRREIICSKDSPAAIGPYSQAVKVSDAGLIFMSGQIPLDPVTGELIEGGVADQTRRVMDNMKAVLEEAGVGFSNVIKTTIYLLDMKDFGTVNEIYGSYFAGDPPARVTVAVSGLPKGSSVEIDCIAAI